MIPKLESAEYVKEHTLRVRLADGAAGDIDLKAELWGEVFEPLKDPEVFRWFRLDEELNTVIWPSGPDLAPDVVGSAIPGGAEVSIVLRSGSTLIFRNLDDHTVYFTG